jgi:bifunctional DNA-binding transcriptional regulator/antitoxin component of YhaV-PrlF toxin-antitoxin module
VGKVTSKLQVTVPKAIADEYRIRPGDEILWVASGDSIRIALPGRGPAVVDLRARLRLFDQATERQRQRRTAAKGPKARGWTREELYVRGRPR